MQPWYGETLAARVEHLGEESRMVSQRLAQFAGPADDLLLQLSLERLLGAVGGVDEVTVMPVGTKLVPMAPLGSFIKPPPPGVGSSI